MRTVQPLLSVLLLFGTDAAEDPPSTQQELAAKVLQATGFTAAINQLPAQIEAGLASLVASGDPTVTVTARLCNQAFDPPRIMAETTDYLAQRATSQQLLSLLELAESPLHSKMTALEVQAAGVAARQKLTDFARSLAFFPPQEHRLAQVQRLDQVTGASELVVQINLRIFRAMMQGISRASPGFFTESADSLDAIVATLENDLRGPLKQNSLVMLLFAYRDCSDEELERYVAELARPPVANLTRLCAEAVKRALEHAASELGQEAAKLAPATQR